MLIYSWIIHWVIIQWAVLKINKKYPFRNARFAPLSMRREFGVLLIALVVIIYQLVVTFACRDPPRSEFSH